MAPPYRSVRWPSCVAKTSKRDTELRQLRFGELCPTSVRLRAGGARMQDGADGAAEGRQGPLRPLHRESADAHDVPGVQYFDDMAQRPVACGEERRSFVGGQLVRREVSAARLHEDERAIINHK